MKNRNFFLAIIVSMIILLAANPALAAISNEANANMWYEEAERSFNNQDCINANTAANKALTLYSMDGNSEGVLKTTNLIGRISSCLKSNGDVFYGQALQKYTEQLYSEAITWANKAREQYAALPDNLSVAKCDKIISDSNDRITANLKSHADQVFLTARKLYENKDYVNALINANEALSTYNEIGDFANAEICQALISAINNDKFEIKQLSDSKLLQATELYAKALTDKKFDDFATAKKLASEAQAGYSKIGDTEGYNSAVEVVKGINVQISMLEATFKKMAEDDYNEAAKQFLLGKAAREDSEKVAYFQKAITAYTNSSDKYKQLVQWANDIGNGSKSNMYNELVKKCSAMIKDVENELGGIDSARKADDLYTEAYNLYTQGECKNATTKANESKAVFTKIKDQAGIFKTDTLIYQINECIKKLATADGLMMNSTSDYGVADYDNATNKTKAAIELYNQTKYVPGYQKAVDFQKNITKAVELKKQADKDMSKAEVSLEQNKLEEAKALVAGAERTYLSINYSAGIEKSQALKGKINEKIDKLNIDNLWGITITGGALFLAIILVAVSSHIKKSSKQKKEKEERIKEERAKAEAETTRRQTEAKKESERVKELEAERLMLKAMVEDEIHKIEQEKKSDTGQ
jgi:hypothetical protein